MWGGVYQRRRIFPSPPRVVVDKVFPLDQVSEAHTMMEADGNIGKIILQIE